MGEMRPTWGGRDSPRRLLFNAWRDVGHPLAGGSEVLIDKLATGLSERGYEVTLRCGRPISEHVYPTVDAGGRFGQYIRSPLDYMLRHRDADLVVDVANGMTYFTPLYRSRASLCFVHHVHTEHWEQWFRPPLAALGRNLERHVTPRVYRNQLFIAVSPSTAEALEAIGVDPSHIRIVTNGTDLPDVVRPKSAEPTFLALGRLVPHKRYELLAEAWTRVRPHVGGRLLIAGEGPGREALEAIDAPGTVLLGRVSEEEKDRLLGEAWALMHPSSLEGWGLVVMEAAARATPTLGFTSPGVRDSVVNGSTGVLVDDVDAFVREWIALSQDHVRRQALGTAARQRAAAFSWDRTIDHFEAVAEEAVCAPPLRRRDRTKRQTPPSDVPATVMFTPSRDATPAMDLTIVVLVPHDGLPLRALFARWRSMVTPAATEIVIVAADQERESRALVDATLGGFERCRPATEVAAASERWDVIVTVASPAVVVVNATRVEGIDVLLATAPDLLCGDVRRAASDLVLALDGLAYEHAPDGAVAVRWDGAPVLVGEQPDSARTADVRRRMHARHHSGWLVVGMQEEQALVEVGR